MCDAAGWHDLVRAITDDGGARVEAIRAVGAARLAATRDALIARVRAAHGRP
jgi:hypothetical protein